MLGLLRLPASGRRRPAARRRPGRHRARAGGSGTQLSLFDVSGSTPPRRLQQRALAPGSSSAVEWDHRAFLLLAGHAAHRGGRLTRPPGGAGFRRAVTRQAIEPLARVSHQAWITRSAVIGDRLFTVSDYGVTSSALSTRRGGSRVRTDRPSGEEGGSSSDQPSSRLGRAAGARGACCREPVRPRLRRARRPVLPARRQRRLRRQALLARPRLRARRPTSSTARRRSSPAPSRTCRASTSTCAATTSPTSRSTAATPSSRATARS